MIFLLRRFTVYRLPFTVCYPFTVYRYQGIRDKSEGTVKGEELRANEATEGGVF